MTTTTSLLPPQDTTVKEIALRLAPDIWRDTHWVGEVSGRATTRDLLAGELLPKDELRSVCRVYAAACGDLAQATLGGVAPRSADWEHWFAELRAAARTLSPARGDGQIVLRALFHGDRLEGPSAPWSHRLRRGFTALLAASLPEPIPALIGEDAGTFHAVDAAWRAQHAGRDNAVYLRADRLAPSDSGAAPRVAADARLWPTAWLQPNPLQPRGQLDAAGVQELAASIAAHAAEGGILQPLVITPDGIVVCGHRRLAAARVVGLAQIPVVVHDLSPAQQLEVMLVENIQRQDLSPLEEARAYQRLVDAGYTQAAIARVVGTSTNRVASRLILLRLDGQVQAHFHRGERPVGLATVLVRVSDPIRQRRLASLAARRGLSVAQLEALVDRASASQTLGRSAAPSALPADDDPAGGGLSTSRRATLDALRARGNRHVSLGELAAVAESVCCRCGMASLPVICAACPLAELLATLLARTATDAS